MPLLSDYKELHMKRKDIYVYLAGPISGCTEGEANDWRDYFSEQLQLRGKQFVGVSPLRCEPIIGPTYTQEYQDKRFGTPSAIATKNYEDVLRCDVTVAYIPESYGKPSFGTISELNWAFCNNKPRILITDDPAIANNAVIKAITPWIFAEDKGFEEAADVIEGIFEVYT